MRKRLVKLDLESNKPEAFIFDKRKRRQQKSSLLMITEQVMGIRKYRFNTVVSQLRRKPINGQEHTDSYRALKKNINNSHINVKLSEMSVHAGTHLKQNKNEMF